MSAGSSPAAADAAPLPPSLAQVFESLTHPNPAGLHQVHLPRRRPLSSTMLTPSKGLARPDSTVRSVANESLYQDILSAELSYIRSQATPAAAAAAATATVTATAAASTAPAALTIIMNNTQLVSRVDAVIAQQMATTPARTMTAGRKRFPLGGISPPAVQAEPPLPEWYNEPPAPVEENNVVAAVKSDFSRTLGASPSTSTLSLRHLSLTLPPAPAATGVSSGAPSWQHVDSSADAATASHIARTRHPQRGGGKAPLLPALQSITPPSKGQSAVGAKTSPAHMARAQARATALQKQEETLRAEAQARASVAAVARLALAASARLQEPLFAGIPSAQPPRSNGSVSASDVPSSGAATAPTAAPALGGWEDHRPMSAASLGPVTLPILRHSSSEPVVAVAGGVAAASLLPPPPPPSHTNSSAFLTGVEYEEEDNEEAKEPSNRLARRASAQAPARMHAARADKVKSVRQVAHLPASEIYEGRGVIQQVSDTKAVLMQRMQPQHPNMQRPPSPSQQQQQQQQQSRPHSRALPARRPDRQPVSLHAPPSPAGSAATTATAAGGAASTVAPSSFSSSSSPLSSSSSSSSALSRSSSSSGLLVAAGGSKYLATAMPAWKTMLAPMHVARQAQALSQQTAAAAAGQRTASP